MTSKPIQAAPKDKDAGQRIAKVIARSGLCSRRDAERWIAAGRVVLNGTRLDSPAVTVTAQDVILVDDQPLPETVTASLWRYHKPAGLVVSHRDEKNRLTVFEKLPEDMPRVISIGRLDINTEGLLLLTNDGELARQIELPQTGWVRRYRVRVHGVPKQDDLDRLKSGITIDGIRYGSIEAHLDRTQASNSWLTLALREGKNREIKKICDHFGWPVTRLIRTSFGPFQLGELKRGEIAQINPKVLKDQLGRHNKTQAKSKKRPHADHRRNS